VPTFRICSLYWGGEKTTRVFSFVDESPDLLLPTRKRADPLTQKTLLAQVVRIQAL
jgi:hypothetical protein